MSYGNSMALPYAQYPQTPYAKKDNGVGSVFGAMTVGALGGGTVGYLVNRNPINSDGKASDAFAKQVSEKLLKIDSGSSKLHKQINEVLKKIDGVKDSADLKKLLDKNKEAAKDICNGLYASVDDMIKMVYSDNIKSVKEKIKDRLKSSNEMMYQHTKNIIEKCWDKDTKEFIKPESVKQKIFDIVKNTKSKGQWKKALKYGGITVGVMGALTIAYKMINPAGKIYQR